MDKIYTIIKPSYVEGFQCIGGECSDSCCIGWNIDIDKISYRKYFKTTNTLMKKEFSRHLKKNNYTQDDNIDYGYMKIDKRKWCPFLDDSKLCKIYSNLGDDSLSNVCHTYPRVYNLLDGIYEISMYMSCPVVIKKLMSDKNPIKFTHERGKLDRHIIHSSINTSDKIWKNSPVKKLKELRDSSIKLVQDRTLSLDSRLLQLGSKLYNNKSGAPIKVKNSNSFKIMFFSDCIKLLNVFTEIDSNLFKDYTTNLNQGLKLFDNVSLNDKTKIFEDIISKVVNPFIKNHEYLFENYLVNYMFQSNFPFNVDQDSFNGFLITVVRYTFIRFYLSGVALKKGKLTIEDVINMVQVHTKTVSHHASFLPNILETIHKKQFNNMDFIRLLLN